jgi:hypothetical protein
MLHFTGGKGRLGGCGGGGSTGVVGTGDIGGFGGGNGAPSGGAADLEPAAMYARLSKHFATAKDSRTVKQFTEDNSPKIEDSLKLPHQSLRHLTWYFGWSDLPTNTFLIACDIEKGRIPHIYVEKTFDFKKSWRVSGLDEHVTYVLESGFKGFNYSLSRGDRRVIRASLNELWKKGKGNQNGRIIHINEAAPILLSALKGLERAQDDSGPRCPAGSDMLSSRRRLLLPAWLLLSVIFFNFVLRIRRPQSIQLMA